MKNFTNPDKPKISKEGFLAVLTLLFFIASLSAQTNTLMRNITAFQLTADMGPGWNLGNTLDAHGTSASGLSTETVWGNPLTTEAMILKIKEAGFKTVRIPVTWYQHIGGAPDYTIDPAWLSRVQEVVNYAFDNGLYVIINTHHDSKVWLATTYSNEVAATAQLEKIW